MRRSSSDPEIPVLSYGVESPGAKWHRRAYIALTVCTVLWFIWFWSFGSLRTEFSGNPPVLCYRWFHWDLPPNEVLDTGTRWRWIISPVLGVLAFAWLWWTWERLVRRGHAR